MNPDSCLLKNASGRMAADDRRLQILQVAMELFSQRGFGGTTTREIALAAGVSEAIIFRHFTTKQELYKAILDHQICHGGGGDKMSEIAEIFERKDDYQIFYQLGLGAMKHHQEDVDFMRLLFFSALEGHELAQMFFEGFVAEMYDRLGGYIEQRQQDGAFRIDVQPRVVVRAFVGMLIHHSLNNILWDKKRRLLDISDEEAARQFTEILLGGIKIKDQG
ncbi:MAG TPA: helix-turn-helix domain-containing protein [Pyrinomonadaceae bacterium]